MSPHGAGVVSVRYVCEKLTCRWEKTPVLWFLTHGGAKAAQSAHLFLVKEREGRRGTGSAVGNHMGKWASGKAGGWHAGKQGLSKWDEWVGKQGKASECPTHCGGGRLPIKPGVKREMKILKTEYMWRCELRLWFNPASSLSHIGLPLKKYLLPKGIRVNSKTPFIYIYIKAIYKLYIYIAKALSFWVCVLDSYSGIYMMVRWNAYCSFVPVVLWY